MTAQRPPKESRRGRAGVEPCSPAWPFAVLLVALTAAAYLPALRAGYVWDDDDYVTANVALRSPAGLRRIWTEPGAVPQYYPLTFTTFWVEYRLWQLRPFGYHLVNVLLHALSAVLLWRLLRALDVPGAPLAAAIFAVHPVHVESVAWITERKNTLSGVFFLAAALAYVRFALAPPRRDGAQWRWYGLAVALFVCALLAKTVAASLPAVLAVVLWWKRGRLGARDVAPLLPLLLLGAAFGSVTAWVERHHVGALGADWNLPFVDRCLIAGRALWFYAGRLAWPHPLLFVYPRWTIDATQWWQYVYPFAAAAVVAALFALRGRIGRGPLAAVLCFAVALAPALGFVDVFPMRYSFVADHFQYLASIALIALVSALATAGWRRIGPAGARAGPVAAAAAVALLAALSARRASAYRDAETLWRDTLAKNPGAWMAHNNLGLLLSERGQIDEAIAHYRAALAVKADDHFALNNLGNAFAAQGRTEEAIAHFQAALRIAPHHAEARNNLGNVLAGLGRYGDAAAEYAEALRSRPGYAEAHNNLGNVLALDGQTDAAQAHYNAALRLDPDYADAHYNLGVLLAAAGHNDRAAAHWREALRLKPEYAAAREQLEELRRGASPPGGGGRR